MSPLGVLLKASLVAVMKASLGILENITGSWEIGRGLSSFIGCGLEGIIEEVLRASLGEVLSR